MMWNETHHGMLHLWEWLLRIKEIGNYYDLGG